ncbi:branched-chain amino acid ABC transporter ATP-binding protein [Azospirillum argentinense]|uniref:Branched-chain amino acid ABC transporter ATP-binding protein n=1 Tax=Azospirillum argentinense TaxID=2970906 RepID=A0A060DMP9_9PROT|nr:ABC transporter ATP-binding protein [Azospirillum argentinense]AIB12109.1 branched-chain amino acid ABC transporter ATP-binding protein [Azospirillum argentinense]EZQ08971.1 branched-chain amino acid ABC transporter ATP-binding protein [Azospirillum argentinense]
MSEPLLRVEELSAGYGGAVAVDRLSLSVAAGEAVALLGANGAGKSTLLKAILGLVPATGGRVRLAGEEIGALAPERRVRRGLGYVPEGRRVFPGMSVRDNLEVASWLGRTERACDLERVFALFPALEGKAEERAWRLSGGQQQMLAVGRALMGRPRVLLLDEPSLGLSPKLAGEVFAAVRAIAATGTAVLVAEQSAARALSAAGRVVLLRLGRAVHDGPVDTLPADAVRDAFLGG